MESFTSLGDSFLVEEILLGPKLSSFGNRLIFAARYLQPGHPEKIVDSSEFEFKAKFQGTE